MRIKGRLICTKQTTSRLTQLLQRYCAEWLISRAWNQSSGTKINLVPMQLYRSPASVWKAGEALQKQDR